LIIDKFGRTFFLFTFSNIETNTRPNIHRRVLGVDVGVHNLAVTSERRFYGGKHIRHLRKKHNRLIGEIQSKCTKASRRKLKRLSGSWRRFMRIENHKISKDIVSKLNSGDVIVMEDLTNIRRTARYNKWVHKWAFRQLQSFIEYKSLRKGIRVVYVNPKYTSKECSRCHNRDTIRVRGFTRCKTCGYSCNSDLIGATNIAGRYILSSRGFVNGPNFSSDDSLLCVCHCEHDVCDEDREKPYLLR
jgi:IS605 OrfB family transposase